MAAAGFHGVDPRGIDAAMAQQIGQTDDVLFDGVKDLGEKVPEIMGEYLAPRHVGFFAQPLHHTPDIAAVERFAVSSDKHRPGLQAGLFYIFFQQFLQRRGDENHPRLVFAVHHRLAVPHRLHGDILQLADPDSRPANGLQDMR